MTAPALLPPPVLPASQDGRLTALLAGAEAACKGFTGDARVLGVSGVIGRRTGWVEVLIADRGEVWKVSTRDLDEVTDPAEVRVVRDEGAVALVGGSGSGMRLTAGLCLLRGTGRFGGVAGDGTPVVGAADHGFQPDDCQVRAFFPDDGQQFTDTLQVGVVRRFCLVRCRRFGDQLLYHVHAPTIGAGVLRRKVRNMLVIAIQVATGITLPCACGAARLAPCVGARIGSRSTACLVRWPPG